LKAGQEPDSSWRANRPRPVMQRKYHSHRRIDTARPLARGVRQWAQRPPRHSRESAYVPIGARWRCGCSRAGSVDRVRLLGLETDCDLSLVAAKPPREQSASNSCGRTHPLPSDCVSFSRTVLAAGGVQGPGGVRPGRLIETCVGSVTRQAGEVASGAEDSACEASI